MTGVSTVPNPLKRAIKGAIHLAGYEVTRAQTEDSLLDLSRLRGGECLVAGPFLGEFGWELMQWQGYVRQLAKFYDETIVFGRGSSSYFYQDFASEFKVVECNSWDTQGYHLYGFDYNEWADQFSDCDLLVADERCCELRGLFDQAFITFGAVEQTRAYDVVLHARNIPNLVGNPDKHERNWPAGRWDELCRELDGLRIAAVGIPELAYCPEGVTDLRGINTEALCSVLASSRVCVGPSSGLIHLATLCRTPQLTWTPREYTAGFGGSEFRYVRSWNPFATPVRVLTDMGLAPTVEYVHIELRNFLAELSRRVER